MNLLQVRKQNKAKRLKLVQLGESGSGKTHRALTATDFGPMYIFDCDGKLENYANSGLLTDNQLSLIEFDYVKNSAQVMAKLREFKSMGDKLPHATIVLDTFSRWNEILISEITEVSKKKMQIQDWGELKNINAKFLKELFSLPCNIIINAHLAEKENAVGELAFTAGGAGSASQMLPEFVDECHYLFIQKPANKHTVQGKGSGKLTIVKSLLKDKIKGLNFEDGGLEIFKKFAHVLDTSQDKE